MNPTQPISEQINKSFHGTCHNANFPVDDEGRVYHLCVKRGEVANRLISVGDSRRALLLSTLLDSPEQVHVTRSNRGFTVYTGRKNGVPISIVATGMGFPMIDFVVRECRAVVDGPMVMVRLGTCGSVHPDIPIGSMVVAAKGSTFVRRNPDAFEEQPTEASSRKSFPYYEFTKVIPADKELSSLLMTNLEKYVPDRKIFAGLNATADSFYSSQGRTDSNFVDHNETLVDDLVAQLPELCTLEMETFHLLDLARCSAGHSIRASACTIVLAQRRSNEFLDTPTIHLMEKQAGEAVLQAISQATLNEKELMDGPECVWNRVATSETVDAQQQQH